MKLQDYFIINIVKNYKREKIESQITKKNFCKISKL